MSVFLIINNEISNVIIPRISVCRGDQRSGQVMWPIKGNSELSKHAKRISDQADKELEALLGTRSLVVEADEEEEVEEEEEVRAQDVNQKQPRPKTLKLKKSKNNTDLRIGKPTLFAHTAERSVSLKRRVSLDTSLVLPRKKVVIESECLMLSLEKSKERKSNCCDIFI